MVMTIRVISSGAGYECLLTSVAAADVTHESDTPLTRCYTEPGYPPGAWTGTGLNSLGTIARLDKSLGETQHEQAIEKIRAEERKKKQ
jgi:hypothetical protein